jgi:hypothetical protein
MSCPVLFSILMPGNLAARTVNVKTTRRRMPKGVADREFFSAPPTQNITAGDFREPAYETKPAGTRGADIATIYDPYRGQTSYCTANE